MNKCGLFSLALATAVLATPPAIAQSSGGFGVVYLSEECNNDADYLTEREIVCTAVFSDTNVWDFLNGLPQRITLEELDELNPRLTDVSYETIISGISFVRVR